MKCALLGSDVSHSFSKEIHAVFGKYEYDLVSLPPAGLKDFLADRQYDGLNITMPYKKEIIKYCDEVTSLAKRIGAVNTVCFENGKMTGDNTDYSGFLYMARRAGVDFKEKTAVILGNGGAAAMVKFALKEKGAKKIITNHRGTCDGDESEAEILINCTPVGKHPDNYSSPAKLEKYPKLEAVLDLNYNPLNTKLVQQAREKGLKAENGLSMLVMQALASGARWCADIRPSAKAAEGVVRIIEKRCRNIVFIGMGGSGKSSVAKELAKLTKRPFADSDKLIIQKLGMSIPQIFEKYGEEYFRKAENEIIKEIAAESGYVIATGGGAIVNEENMEALSQNGYFVFLNRAPEKLSTYGRPLYTDLETIKKIYAERIETYRKYADLEIAVADNLYGAAGKIFEQMRKK